uniref:C3H1-type domain-containing protein n=1 Tax=Macrostomum lignano TaxID=282301 RepID=A0A1I8IAP2_9PLAT
MLAFRLQELLSEAPESAASAVPRHESAPASASSPGRPYFGVTPAGGQMNRRPAVPIASLRCHGNRHASCRCSRVQQKSDHAFEAVGARHVQQIGALRRVQAPELARRRLGIFGQRGIQIGQHGALGLVPGRVDLRLRHAWGFFFATELSNSNSRLLVNQQSADAKVAAGGCCVQRSPQLAVPGVDVGLIGQQQAAHLSRVVDAGLVEGSQAVLVRSVRVHHGAGRESNLAPIFIPSTIFQPSSLVLDVGAAGARLAPLPVALQLLRPTLLSLPEPAKMSLVNPGLLQLASMKDSRWLTLEVCREFQRSKCSRTEIDCKFAHPPKHVDVQNGRVVCCYDYIKGKCQRKEPPCKYLHPPQHLREQLLQNGRNNLIIKSIHMQMLSQTLAAGGTQLLPLTAVSRVTLCFNQQT